MTLREISKKLLGVFRPKPVLLLTKRRDLAKFEMGRWSYGDFKVLSFSKNGALKIGSFCSFADGSTILLGGEHRWKAATTFPIGVFLGGAPRDAHENTKGDVVIGNDVWVGREVTILSGVTIGDGAVIGAKSLVTSDVPPYTIFAGNPARTVRKRFDDSTISRMLAIKWWDWPDEKIVREARHLLGDDVSEFLRRSEVLEKKHQE